jgi:hypothetical protein
MLPSMLLTKQLRVCTDCDTIPFAPYPTIGAFEINPVTSVPNFVKTEYAILENGVLHHNNNEYKKYKIYNYLGNLQVDSDIISEIINLEQIKENYLIIILESEKSRKVMIVGK